MKIAVSGKGGVGKTTVAANLIYHFAKNGFDVFAVDADPDASLGLALGVDPQKLATLVPLVEMEEVIAQKSGGKGAFYNLNPDVEDVVDDYSPQAESHSDGQRGRPKSPSRGSHADCRPSDSVLLQLFPRHKLLPHRRAGHLKS